MDEPLVGCAESPPPLPPFAAPISEMASNISRAKGSVLVYQRLRISWEKPLCVTAQPESVHNTSQTQISKVWLCVGEPVHEIHTVITVGVETCTKSCV